MFSMLACLNNVICFSFAPIAHRVAVYYELEPADGNGTGAGLNWFVTIFFILYLVITVPTSMFIDKYGLRTSVVVAGDDSSICNR